VKSLYQKKEDVWPRCSGRRKSLLAWRSLYSRSVPAWFVQILIFPQIHTEIPTVLWA
jgi:hypothetical protein